MSAAAAKRPLSPGAPGPAAAKAKVGKSAPPTVAKTAPLAKTPAAAKAPLAKTPAVAKAPAAESPKAAASPPAETAAPKRKETWREFQESDPLYAIIGQMSQNKIFTPDGTFQPDLMQKYLEILIVQKAAKKPKEWVEVWAAMDIPVNQQAVALEPLLVYAWDKSPEQVGKMLAELLKGHRVKTKAVEDAVNGAIKGLADKHSSLREFLFLIFPKGPQSEWGWSRVGWSWQEWWKLLSHLYESIDATSAFDECAALLNKIEATGGKPLAEQTQVWNEMRLGKARALLCKLGSVEEEKDLMACMDATLFAS